MKYAMFLICWHMYLDCWLSLLGRMIQKMEGGGVALTLWLDPVP